MLRLVLLLFDSVRAALNSRADLVIENLAVVCQNSIVTLDDGMTPSDAGAQCPSYSLSWARRVLRSGPTLILRLRIWRSGNNSPCSATARSDRGSGPSTAPSGCGSLGSGPGGARHSMSFAPRP